MPNRLANPILQSDTPAAGAGTVTVTTSDGALVAANPGRVEVTITNTDGTNFVCLALGTTAALNAGVYLAPKASYTTRAFTGAIRAIASVASCVVAYVEI